ncbi:MAG: orotidine-5'-phosphate decarboxylase [Syntrophorhabdaceae bacterium]|nr:orotidine-5'-phosphate decarboxylase [Syntrophorhabdaceae bacterium]MDD4195949.1 orotidine-5'-phosphate decarboxylase [Syntrophorhabdaceae bacterium]
MDPRAKMIFALDVDHFEEAQQLVLEFKDHVGMFKVGKQLFTQCGPKIVDYIKMKNSKVFLDLKYHDIPNTVAKASVEAAKLGVDILNVHASGGFPMMSEAKRALVEAGKNPNIQRPKIIGVTVLTSLDDNELKRVGFNIPVIELTRRLATLAKEAGLDGVVAGGSEIEMIREICGKDFLIITPGVRLEEKRDDQKRTVTPHEAIKRGASYIVLGRAVRDAPDPKGLLKKITGDIRNALTL